MAKIPDKLTQRQIDRIVTAARPRILQRGHSVSGGGGSGTVPAHTHPASAVSFEPAGDIAGDDVQEGMEELAEEKLARDGHQPMTGDLDMDCNDIVDPASITMCPSGSRLIDNVQTIQMDGSAVVNDPKTINMDATAETLLRYLDTIEFDLAGQHTTHVEGALHWDSGFDLLVTDVATPDGVWQLPLQATYFQAKASGFGIAAGRPVSVQGYFLSPNFIAVDVAHRNDLDGSQDVAGITVEAMATGTVGWICSRGLVRVVGAFAGLNGAVYLDSFGNLTTTPPNDAERGCYWRVRMGYVISDDYMLVDIERWPTLQELSDVVSTDTAPPVCGDVLVHQLEPTQGNCPQWRPSGLWNQVTLDFGSGDKHEMVFELPEDSRVKSASDIITMVHSAVPAAGSDEDEAEFDAFACACVPFYDPLAYSGQGGYRVRAYIHALRGKVVGQYVFNYTVSNPASYVCVVPPEV